MNNFNKIVREVRELIKTNDKFVIEGLEFSKISDTLFISTEKDGYVFTSFIILS